MDILTLLKEVPYVGAIVFIVWIFLKQQRNLLDRLMAKDFEQYNYYKSMFKEEVDELKKARDDVRKEKTEDEEIKEVIDSEYENEQKFLKDMEEDWKEEDVDLPELKERLSK